MKINPVASSYYTQCKPVNKNNRQSFEELTNVSELEENLKKVIDAKNFEGVFRRKYGYKLASKIDELSDRSDVLLQLR